jgi:hypothetical protein
LRKLLVGVVLSIAVLLAAAPALATPPSSSNASCVGRLSEADAQAQQRDDVARSIAQAHTEEGAPPPGALYSHFATVHEGETFEECLTEQN